MTIFFLGIDLAKNVFALHSVDDSGFYARWSDRFNTAQAGSRGIRQVRFLTSRECPCSATRD